MTKDELRIIKQAAKDMEILRHRCYVNAQRLAMYCEGDEILYHEGTFGGCLAHAWNSINGKLLDISSGVEQIVPSECYHMYVPHGTYTKRDIVANNIKNGTQWNWLGDPETMGEMHKEEAVTSADDRDSI